MISNYIQGFKVLPLQFSASSTSCHNLFIKEHSMRHVDESKPTGKTLFVLNVPPYVSENNLKLLFSKAGCIKSVILENSNENNDQDGFKRAFIIFEKRESLLRVMKLDKFNTLSTDDVSTAVGLEKWTEAYNFGIQSSNDLQNEINIFMSNYEREEKKKKTDKESLDDEGWTVVTKKSRKSGVSRKESVELKLNEKSKSTLKKKQLKNFYTFQIRESKMEHIATLRRNFEEAKSKINLMKKARKFRPY